MADFSLYFPKLLAAEGGYSDTPGDGGGPTNKGITLATFTLYAQSLLGVAPTLANLQALTDDQAAKIYKPEYWDAVCGDGINDQLTAEIIADAGVNSGTGTAVRMAQRILASMGFTKVAVDGSCGPITLGAINSANTQQFYSDYKQARIDYYKQIVQNKPSQAEFLQGWLDRVNIFPDADEMA